MSSFGAGTLRVMVGDGPLQPRAVPDGDAVQGQGRRVGRRLDAEREHLALGLLHGQDLAYLEGAVIDGAALPAVGNELDHGRAQPALGALEGGLEGEQAVGLLVHGDGGGQFDADGRAVAHHAARVRFHVVGKSRVQGFGPLGGASRQESGGKGQEGPQSNSTHIRSGFYSHTNINKNNVIFV